MSKLTIDRFLLCVVVCVACAACSSDPAPPGASADPFVGTWACSDELAITFTAPPGIPAKSVTQSSKLVVASANGGLTASKETDGASCQVAFTSNGKTATLTTGQTCTTTEGLVLSYKSGSATVNGSSMSSSFDFDASGNVTVNSMMVPAMATGSQASTCSRLSAPPSSGTTTGGW